jgi:hypothetical protein
MEDCEAGSMKLRDQAKGAVALVAEIKAELDAAQGRCSARCLTVQDVLDAIVNAPYEQPRVYVASAYKYPYTWTGLKTEEHGDAIRWGVQRVSAKYQQHADRVVGKEVLGHGLAWGGALLDGDVIAIKPSEKAKHYIRYNAKGQRTGVCCYLPKDLRDAHGGWNQWEHAKTAKGLAHEIAFKRLKIRDAAAAARLEKKQERKARLLARLSKRLQATYQDARSCGFCHAGIRAWADHHGVPIDGSVALDILAHDNNRSAQVVALHVARNFLRANLHAA